MASRGKRRPIRRRPQQRREDAADVQRSLDMAHWARHERVLLVGDYGYYKRFGFRPAAPHGIVMPGENPARLLALSLVGGALDGTAGPIQPRRWVRGRGGELIAAMWTGKNHRFRTFYRSGPTGILA